MIPMCPSDEEPDLQAARRELYAVAASAVRAVSCDLVVVTGIPEMLDGPVWAAVDGVAPTAELVDALTAAPEERDLLSLGYRRHHSAELWVDTGFLGVLHALRREDEPLDETLVEGFASHSAFTLAYGRLNREIQRATMFDQLALATNSFDELIPRLEQAVSSIGGPVMVGVSAWDAESGLLELVPRSFRSPLAITDAHSVDPKDLHSNASRVFALQRPFVSNAARGDPAILQSYVEVFGLESLMALPLELAGRPTGVLLVANKAGGFAPQDLTRCEEVAPRVAVAVELTRMHLRLRLRGRADRLLSELSLETMRHRGPPGPADPLLAQLGELVGAEVLAVVPWEPGEDPVVHLRPDSGTAAVAELVTDARRRSASSARTTSPPASKGTLHLPAGLENRWSVTLSARRRDGRFTHDQRNTLVRAANILALGHATRNVRDQRVALARLKERHRIADDLHDEVGQLLFVTQIAVDTALEAGPGASDTLALRRISALLVRASSAIREVVFALSAPPEGTLTEQLETVGHEIVREWPVEVDVHVEADAQVLAEQAGTEVAAALVRVARECLVNSAKHAGPCSTSVRLEQQEKRLRLRVSDDGGQVSGGVGPAGSPGGGHGIRSLRRMLGELDGTLSVEHSAGGGTCVTAELPV